MAIIYCDAAGSNTAPYDSWATAATTLQTALSAWATGDVIYVKSGSDVGGTTGNLTLTGGTIANRIPIYSANASNVYTKSTMVSPNIDLTTNGAALTLSTSAAHKGLAYRTNRRVYINASATSNTLEDVAIEFQYANLCEMYIGYSNCDAPVEFINVDITETTPSGLFIKPHNEFVVTGGSISVATRAAGFLKPYSVRSVGVYMQAVDMGGCTFNGPLVDMSEATDALFLAKFSNCEFPPGITITDGGFGNDQQCVEIIASGSSDASGYNREKHTYRATLTTDTGTYLNGGFTAPDGSGGDQNLSHAITPNSVFKDGARFEGPWLYKMNTVTGSAQTVTIYSADGFTTSPNANQAYIEVVSMSTTGEVLGTLATSRPADLLATTAMDADSSTWAGSPAHTHKMSASFTAQEEGVVAVRVVLEGQDLSAETANSFFYDPEVNIA